MQQIKIFKSIESELSALEEEINAWITEERATVINIFGNIALRVPPAQGWVAFHPRMCLLQFYLRNKLKAKNAY